MTEVLRVDPDHPDPTIIARAAACLAGGGLVAFPTETVYGLGANALNRDAIRRVFAAKERPAHDPLIVHVASLQDVASLVIAIPEQARQLAQRFWPGPLTLVLERSAAVPDEITAGLTTVAIRVPSHPVAHALIEAARVPVAAPSANLFSRPSPTRAAHVLEDLNGRVDMIVDAGPTTVGVESTVVDLSHGVPAILRPGAIDIEALRAFLPNVTTMATARSEDAPLPAQGMLDKHYAPRTPVVLHAGDRATALRTMQRDIAQHAARGERTVALAYTEDLDVLRDLPVELLELGSEAAPASVAGRLYAALREADRANAMVILVRSVTAPHPLSDAINDRLRRAASR